MKKLLLAAAGLMAMSGSAFAADMAAPVYKAPPPPAPVYNWTGCYLEGGGGYGLWNQDSHSETTAGLVPIGVQVTNGGRGWLGRLGAGCDYQVAPIFRGSLVIGAFGEYDFMNLHGTFSDPSGPVAGNEKEKNAWYVGGRIGYAVTPGFLTYFDGGYTQTRFDQVNLIFPIGGASTGLDFGATDYHGWFLGGGTDTSLADLLPGLPAGLFIRSEYRYSSYSAKDVPVVFTATGAPFGVSEHTQKFVQTITTSLVWKFNWH